MALPGWNPAEGAGNLLECALGSCSSGLLEELQLPGVFDAEGATERVAGEPDVWTDGSSVEDKVSGASSSGSVFFFRVVLVVFGKIVGGAILMMILVVTGPLGLPVVIVLFLVFLQTVQRA